MNNIIDICTDYDGRDEKSGDFLDAWAECVQSALQAGDSGILRVIRDGAIPFPCASHGWFGVFPCHGLGHDGRVSHIPVLDIVLSKGSLFLSLPDFHALRHFMLRIPDSTVVGKDHNLCSFKLDVHFEYGYMYVDKMDPSPRVGITVEELLFATGVLFLMTPGIKTLIAAKLWFNEFDAHSLLPHLLTEYGDVDFFSVCSLHPGRDKKVNLKLLTTKDAEGLFFVWMKESMQAV